MVVYVTTMSRHERVPGNYIAISHRTNTVHACVGLGLFDRKTRIEAVGRHK